MKVSQFTQTCGACPSQWEGNLEGGGRWYARYRWGCLTVQVDGLVLIQEDIGGDFDGVMDTEQLKEIMIQNGFSFADAIDLV